MINNMKIGAKIFILAFIMLLAVFSIAVVGYINMSNINQEMESMYNDAVVGIVSLKEARAEQYATEAAMYHIILRADEPEKQREKLKELEDSVEIYNAAMERYKGTKLSQYEQDLIPVIESNVQNYSDNREKILRLALDGRQEEAFNTFKSARGISDKIRRDLNDMSDFRIKSAESIMMAQRQEFQSTTIQFIGLLLISAIFSVVASIVIARNIVRPLNDCVNYMSLVSTGDFSMDVPESFKRRKDEIGSLAKAVQTMKNSVNILINNVINETIVIEDVVEDVNKNVKVLNADLEGVSVATEELAASMQETAASSEEIAETSQEMENAVQSIADKAQEGAGKAIDISEKSKKMMESSERNQREVENMFKETQLHLKKSIEESKSVHKINVLADSILQITSQTNLLALNAAIEAARAGEAGRGFSVVADEIRKLAELSSDTINKIQNTTGVILSSVEDLIFNSNNMLNFIETKIINDYKTLVQTSKEYNLDALYYKDFSTDLSATTQQLLASIQEILKSIDGVANVASEGAEGTMEIANRTSSVVDKSSEILNLTSRAKHSSEKLKEEISKFKV